MQVTVKAIENNARDARGVAVINGVSIEIDTIRTTGSEKQVAWADQIARKALRLVAEEIVRKAAPQGLIAGADLDTLMVKVNAQMAAAAAKLDGKPAKAWIDSRDLLPIMTVRAVAAA